MSWSNRIVGLENVDPTQLLAHPGNFRRHPGAQRDALRGSLGTIGWIATCIVNRQTGYVIDGHARIEEALSKHEKTVPVLYVDLSPAEERLALATLDPIGEMATRDQDALNELIEDIQVDDAGLQALLDTLSKPTQDDPLGSPETPADEVTCPSCGTTFSLGIRVKPNGKSPTGNEFAGGN